MSSRRGFHLVGEPSRLTYKKKSCPKCGNSTTIEVSHSDRNPDKLYYRCDRHRFVGWCLPTNVGTMIPTGNQRIEDEKRDEDVKRDMDHDIKIVVKNKVGVIVASCKNSSVQSLLLIAVVVSALVVITLKLTVI